MREEKVQRVLLTFTSEAGVSDHGMTVILGKASFVEAKQGLAGCRQVGKPQNVLEYAIIGVSPLSVDTVCPLLYHV